MSDPARDPTLTPLQRAALAMRELRARLDRAEAQQREGIAVVGIGCRFPGGASTPDAYWDLLRSGRDTVVECPRDRWDADLYFDANPDRPGTVATRHGSFLDRVDEFDARFFGISAGEAESLDPQQRLLLEVAWEAIEHAGVPPDSLRGSRTGVFVGIGQNDYARRRLLGGDVQQIGPYDGTGNGFCFASGRLSHVLGLQGPNLAVDTACSASLVSVHLASQSLRLRECDLALAGGVQLMLSPEVTIFLSRAHALSPDGRCRTFDAGADGYGRGEGCGLVVLKRLSDASRDGDHVYAVLRGSAVNHDGTSSGLTVPNAPAQQALIRDALTRAGLEPGDIDYVEAHGTATPLGDPIEIAGLQGVFAPRGPIEPLRIGSVKTNLGHLEAAAGIAGLIKVVLALEHGEIPPHLHCETLNPRVRWDELPLRVARHLEPWGRGPRVRRAGVSSFGISGTNAHLVLEESPAGAAPGRMPLARRTWQRERYWIEAPAARVGPARPAALHPLLHRRLGSPVRRTEVEFETTIDARTDLAAQHRVHGRAVLPAGAYVEMAIAAARATGLPEAGTASLAFHSPMDVADRITVRMVATPVADGGIGIEIFSAPEGAESGWTRHASGRVSADRADRTLSDPPVSIDAVRARLTQTRDPRELGATLTARGLDLGSLFQVIEDVRVGPGEAIARIMRPSGGEWTIDPALLDGCSLLHAALVDTSDLWVQSSVDIDVRGRLSGACWAHLVLAGGPAGPPLRSRAASGELRLLDDAGRVLLRAVQHLRPLTRDTDSHAGLLLYELAWIGDSTGEPAAYRAAERELERLSVDLAGAARLAGLDQPTDPGHARLVRRLTDMRPSDTAAADSSVLASRAAALAAAHPIAATEFELVARCGSRLPDVLRGVCDPLTLLFPAEGASAAALYSTSYAARVMHARMKGVFGQLAGQASGPLRVLEIGAGTGATTEALLPLLTESSEYWFTDVAPVFVEQARTRFSHDARVRCQRLDIEQPCAPQGVEPGSFDIVIAANVLHATRDLVATLAHVRALLRPSGTLVLLEGTSPRAWVDLIFGLTEGWWRFTDTTLRPAHPLLSPAGWRALLETAGFVSTSVWPRAGDGPAGQSLIVAGPETAEKAGRLWLVSGGRDASLSVARALTAQGARAEAVQSSIDDALAAHTHDQLAVVSLPLALPGVDVAGAAMTQAAHTTALMQALAHTRADCPIWFVADSRSPADAPVLGLAQTLALESPGRVGGIVSVDGDWTTDSERLAAELLTSASDGDPVTIRDGARLVPRVRRIGSHTAPAPVLRDGTYLITGGLGAFGLVTAEHLVRRGARHLCLVGRHAPSEAARAVIARLERDGVAVTAAIADVANDAEMGAVLAEIHSSGKPLRGVIHAAGVTGFGRLDETTPDDLERILRPKVAGGWTLHRLTRGLELDFFVCYSSMVSVWGAQGQGPYVAANRFLDALAHHRRAEGLPAVTINWGPLAGGDTGSGMVPEPVTRELLRMGVATTTMPDAVRALDLLLDGSISQPIAVDIDWPRFRALYNARRATAIFDLVDTPTAATPAPIVAAAAPGRDAVLRAHPGDRRNVLLGELRARLARVVTTTAPIDGDAGLFDHGLDSLSAMELRRQLETAFGLTLPPTLLFDCGTLEALATDLLSRLGLEAAPEAMDGLPLDDIEAKLLRKLEELA